LQLQNEDAEGMGAGHRANTGVKCLGDDGAWCGLVKLVEGSMAYRNPRILGRQMTQALRRCLASLLGAEVAT
jgi:hypothetical protein